MTGDSNNLDKLNEAQLSLLEDRSYLELWCDKYNHTFSLFRTIFGFVNILIATFIAIKVFEVI